MFVAMKNFLFSDLPPGVDDEPEPPGIGSAPPPSINPSLRPSVGNIMTNSGYFKFIDNN